MTKRTAYLLLAVLLVAGAGVVVYRTWRNSPSHQSVVPGEQPVAGTGPARVLLNEILFQPAAGESPFVELANMGAESATLDGFALVNQAGERYALPNSFTMPAGGVLLVRFDGQNRVEGATVHANRTAFLEPRSGSVTLISPAGNQDLALWSDTGGPSFRLGRGGRIPPLVKGTTLGRPRGSVGVGRDAWTVFFPAEATPGAPNGFPLVTGMMPLSGAVLRMATPTLTWYSVATATRYQVQVASDRSFASPVFDRTVTASGRGLRTETITVPALTTGRYVWRVQAIFGDREGARAPFSRPAFFRIGIGSRAAANPPRHRDWTRGLMTPLFAAAQSTIPMRKRLEPEVPFIDQQRDTFLLFLEGDETGAEPWDQPWKGLAPYCGRASVAMITAFFKGTLSQDRIGYEAHWARNEGPQHDIDVGVGFEDRDFERALTFALGSAPTKRFDPPREPYGPELIETYWNLIRSEIDDGYPVLATSEVHAWVIVGYGEDEYGTHLQINDPAVGPYDMDWLTVDGLDEIYTSRQPAGTALSTHFFMPRDARGRSDEPEVSKDSDDDGVKDFDETERFHTNPQAKDTDGDGVPDKAEIRAWVFDEQRGYWPAHVADNSDGDGDRKRMEVDEDSDGGGCFDGMEDTNGNGRHEQARNEIYNFDKNDDACLSGSYQFVQDSLFRDADGSTQKLNQRQSIQFSFREIDGVQKGLATVTASYRQELTDPSGMRGCGNRVESTEPYQYVVDVQANVVKMPDGSVSVSVGPPAGWTPPMMRHVSTCPGVPPFEAQAGLNPRIGGVLRNGVFDERVDLPLDREGGTGTKYYETHIRQPRRP